MTAPNNVTTFRYLSAIYDITCDVEEGAIKHDHPSYQELDGAQRALTELQPKTNSVLMMALVSNIERFIFVDDLQMAWNGIVCLSYYIREKEKVENDLTPADKLVRLVVKNNLNGEQETFEKP